MRDLHGDGHAVDQNDLVAPVELVGLARRKAQRNIGCRRRRPASLEPRMGVTPDRIVAYSSAEGRLSPVMLIADDEAMLG